MPTSHWVFSSVDSSSVGPFFVRNLDVVIPAGATMKRFILKGTRLTGKHSLADFEKVNLIYQTSTVDVIAGQYNGRNLYRTTRSVPMEVAAVYDSATFERVYTSYYHAGDLELGFNVKCSFGTASGPGFTVRCQVSADKHGGAFAFPDLRYTFGFYALYFTL